MRTRRPQAVHVYVAAVAASGLALLAWLVLRARGHGPHDPAAFWLFGALILAGEAFPVTLARRDEAGEVTFSQAFALALAIFASTTDGVVALAAASALADLLRRKPPWKLVFNLSQYALALAAAGATAHALGYAAPLDARDLPAVAAGGAAYFVANDVLVGVGVGLAQGARLLPSLRRDVGFWLWTSALQLGMAPIVVLLAERGLAYVLLVTPPLVAVWLASTRTVALTRQTRRTVELLASTVDRRDPYTYDHSARVGLYAAALAVHAGLPDAIVEEVEAAGLVHDLGKIAVPDEVLLSPKAFTDEERKLVQRHPAVGADLLGHLDLYDHVRRVVRHHHERYDGCGYPDGLAGEVIPLGARVIAVADAFDAMTSDRPYRKALPLDVALGELRAGAGRQFDPALAIAFCDLAESHPELVLPDVPGPPVPVRR